MDLKKEYTKTIYNSQNPILFILVIALVNRAIKNYKTTDRIFNLKVLNYNHYISIWVNHMLYIPIFRWPIYIGFTKTNPKSDSLSKQLTTEAQRFCYNKFTAFDFRSERLIFSKILILFKLLFYLLSLNSNFLFKRQSDEICWP